MFSSIVLAGGKALRLGRDKLLEKVGGVTLLQRVIDVLKQLGGEIIIVVNGTPSLPPEYNSKNIKVISDVIPLGGPLGGLYTGLAASRTFHNLVVAGDMPFLNLRLLQHILQSARNGDNAGKLCRNAGYDVVIPRLSGFIEPLHAVYSRRCLSFIKQEIEGGSRNIRSFFSMVRVKYLDDAEIDKFDPDHLSFFNINTEDDLKKAYEIAITTG